MASADVEALKAERSALIGLIRTRTQEWAAAGGEPLTSSLDGESYDFAAWRKAKLDEVQQLTKLINDLSSPWLVRSRR